MMKGHTFIKCNGMDRIGRCDPSVLHCYVCGNPKQDCENLYKGCTKGQGMGDVDVCETHEKVWETC